MRNRKLRVLSLLLVLVMAAGLLAGCGGNDSPKGDDPKQPTGGDKGDVGS